MTYRKNIELKREDLVELKKDTPIEKVDICYFKQTSITFRECCMAETIIFSDGSTIKVLKDRHNNLIPYASNTNIIKV